MVASQVSATSHYLQWMAILLILTIQLLSLSTRGPHHTMPATATRAMRRALQQAADAADAAEDPITVTPLDAIPPEVAPAPEPAQQAAPAEESIAPAPTTDSSPILTPVPAPIPTPKPTSTSVPACDCPAPALPDSLAFLEDVFSWDADRQALIINAKTIDTAGHLIVNGFSGIRQSLFIGGDPNNGESSTEISPGSILMYKAGTDSYPTLAGFQASAEGYDMSVIEVMGGLQVLDPASGKVSVLSDA